jgi:hypothetical protein
MAELAELRPVVAVTAMNDRDDDTHHYTNYTNNNNNTSASSSSSSFAGGFFSSICLGLFEHHAESHSDCCALACCGMFLADRNRYLLTQQLPPPLWQRVALYLIVPLCMLLVIYVVISPTTMPQATKESIQSARTLLSVTVLILLTWLYYCQAVSKRREVRLMIQQRSRYQQQQQQGSGEGRMMMTPPPSLLDSNDLRGHPKCCCCGCYPLDDDRLALNSINNNSNKPRGQRDVCHVLWNLLANLCCGWCCNCWCQCFGMCALAQEDRQLQQLLLRGASPTTSATINNHHASTSSSSSSSIYSFQRDYITMQPFSEYYPRILRLRQQSYYSLWEHGKALSLLSSHLLKWLAGILILIIISSVLPIPNWLQPLQLLVVFGTLGQAFILLYLVHWIYHRFDLSLDAVIKFFASGFCLCTGMAMVYEVLVSLAVGFVLLALKLIVVMIDLLKHASSKEDVLNDDATSSNDSSSSSNDPTDYYNDYMKSFDRHHIGLAILAALVNAYLVAAAVEELAKYFSFWMVEHPDLMWKKNVPSQQQESNMEEGRGVASATTNGTSGGGNETTYETMDLKGKPPQDQEPPSNVVHHDYTLSTSPVHGGDAIINMPTATTSTMPPHRRTNVSLGAAITVAMVATALGFACAENLLYVFAYSPPGLGSELSTLVARSIFPVHPLCAALQSLGVVHRDVILPNGKQTYGLGRVLFPAWLLHGTFDFVLMAVAAYANAKSPPKSSSSSTGSTTDDQNGSSSSSSGTAQQQPPEDDPTVVLASLISMIVSVVLVMVGFTYYQCAAYRQRRELRSMDEGAAYSETAPMTSAMNASSLLGGGRRK